MHGTAGDKLYQSHALPEIFTLIPITVEFLFNSLKKNSNV
jgi:hypothetical protein